MGSETAEGQEERRAALTQAKIVNLLGGRVGATTSVTRCKNTFAQTGRALAEPKKSFVDRAGTHGYVIKKSGIRGVPAGVICRGRRGTDAKKVFSKRQGWVPKKQHLARRAWRRLGRGWSLDQKGENPKKPIVD